MQIKEHLHQLLGLVKIEREEDLLQYQTKMMYTSVQDRKKEGVTWYPVIMTDHYLGTGDKLVVTLEKTGDLEQKHSFQGGATVSFFCNDGQKNSKAVNGIISYVRSTKMKVVLNSDDLPEWHNQGKLGVNLMFDESTYREMESTLKYLIKLEQGRTAELRDIMYGEKAPIFKSSYPINLPKLNESQNAALQHVIAAEDIAIIHGPPGTGKTTTLVQAIKYTVETEKQVMVCTPSNASVDLLVEKLSEENLNILRIGHPARISDAAIANSLDVKIANHPYYRDLRSVRKKSEEMRDIATKYKRKFGYAEKMQRKELMGEVRRLKGEADTIEKYIVHALLDQAQVVVATLAGSNNSLLRGKVFKTVFIDEAAQALEPACWIPMLKAERVVMAGDHQQLPPTVKSFEASKQGLSHTLFERIMQKGEVQKMLTKQYRMHPHIMGFSSSYFYDNGLEADSSVLTRETFTDEPIAFIDTAGCGFLEQINPETRSTFNTEEANLLVKHLISTIETIGVQRINEESISIAVIAPYKAQVAIISDLLEEIILKNEWEELLTINTVDAFQGQERDIIYISLTRGNEAGEIGFLKDIRRMNVAMTRAKSKLVMVGDSSTLGSHGFYNELIDYFQQHDAYKSAFELMYD